MSSTNEFNNLRQKISPDMAASHLEVATSIDGSGRENSERFVPQELFLKISATPSKLDASF
jgi:hypothetical protein